MRRELTASELEALRREANAVQTSGQVDPIQQLMENFGVLSPKFRFEALEATIAVLTERVAALEQALGVWKRLAEAQVDLDPDAERVLRENLPELYTP